MVVVVVVVQAKRCRWTNDTRRANDGRSHGGASWKGAAETEVSAAAQIATSAIMISVAFEPSSSGVSAAPRCSASFSDRRSVRSLTPS